MKGDARDTDVIIPELKKAIERLSSLYSEADRAVECCKAAEEKLRLLNDELHQSGIEKRKLIKELVLSLGASGDESEWEG